MILHSTNSFVCASSSTDFAFHPDRLLPLPHPLAMPLPSPPSPCGIKRGRARHDVDGDGSASMHRKKRRLRLDLITSRLSRPFSTPSTYIVSRGGRQAGKWVRRRLDGKNALRKLALRNWSRTKSGPSVATDHQEAFSSFTDDDDDDLNMGNGPAAERSSAGRGDPTHQRENGRSRFGLSNYQDIDEEDDYDEDDTGGSVRMNVDGQDDGRPESYHTGMDSMDTGSTNSCTSEVRMMPSIGGVPDTMKEHRVECEISLAPIRSWQEAG